MEIIKIRKTTVFRDRDPYFCIWLQELAEMKGLFYKKSSLTTYDFVKDTQCKVRYRTIPKNPGKMSEQEKELFEDSGWEFVDFSTDCSVFFTKDPEAPEIFNDIESYRSYTSRFAILLIAWFACIVYWIWKSARSIIDIYADISAGQDIGLWEATMHLALIITAVLLCTVWIFEMQECIRSIRAASCTILPNYDISYDDPSYLHAKKQRKTFYNTIIALLISLLATWILYIVYNN